MARKRPALNKRASRKEAVELQGEVRAADLDHRQFAVRLDNGTRVVAKFTDDQESRVLEALGDHARQRIRLKGSAEVTPAGKIKRVASVESLAIERVEEDTSVAPRKPIWELALEIGARVPDEEWEKVPTDLAKNLHHYLYGAPKEQE